MVITEKDMLTESRPNMRGGSGDIIIQHLIEGKSIPHARLMARVTIPVSGSIGEHRHDNETEYYIIVSGNGIVKDNGVEKEVTAGDVVVTGGGASHTIRNRGNRSLVLIAIIILD